MGMGTRLAVLPRLWGWVYMDCELWSNGYKNWTKGQIGGAVSAQDNKAVVRPITSLKHSPFLCR